MKRHRFEVMSFVFGVLILVIGVLFLSTATPLELANQIDATFDLGLPILALVIGAALVIPAIRRQKPVAEPPLTPQETAALDELNQTVPPLS
jgi:hypothetical protein